LLSHRNRSRGDSGFEDQRHHRAPSFSTVINQPLTDAASVVLDSLGKPGNNRTRLPRQFLDIYLSRGHLPLLMSGCLHRYFSRHSALCPRYLLRSALADRQNFPISFFSASRRGGFDHLTSALSHQLIASVSRSNSPWLRQVSNITMRTLGNTAEPRPLLDAFKLAS
jgi:hypothetical protein